MSWCMRYNEPMQSLTLAQHQLRWLDTCERIGLADFQGQPKADMAARYLDYLEQALAAGVKVDVCDALGRDGWTLLTQARQRNAGVFQAAARLMIQHGYPVLDHDRMSNLSSSQIDLVVNEICDRVNQDQVLLSPDGGNVLHALARLGPGRLLGFILPTSNDAAVGALAGSERMKSLLDAVDGEGQTPLHVLWRHHGTDPDIWLISYFLWKKGASLERADGAGTNVAQMLVDSVRTGALPTCDVSSFMPGLEQVIHEHYAAAQALVLEDSVQEPDTGTKRPRL